ncbi:MAG: hypothetical protein KJ968_02260, partial [Nanoarchaeota archaeon]|nr:hypothetical protein [Nanoarchaeota archaeon]
MKKKMRKNKNKQIKMKKGKNLIILTTVMLVLITISIGRIVKAEDTLPKIVEGSEETIDGVTYVTLECEGVTLGSKTSLRIAKDMLDTLDWKSFRNVKQEVLNINQEGYIPGDIKFKVTDKDSQEVYYYELGYTSKYGPLEERKIEKNTENIKIGVETIEIWSNNNLVEFSDKMDLADENKIKISEKMSVKKVVSYEQGTNYLDVIIEKDGSLVEGKLKNLDVQTNKYIVMFESKDNSFILKEFVESGLGSTIIEVGLKGDEITYVKKDDGEKINLQGLDIEEVGYNFIDNKITGEIDGKIGLITISDESGEGKYTIKSGIQDLTTIEILGDGSIQKIQRKEKTITSTSSDEEKTISERIWIDENLIYTEINGVASYIPIEFGIKEIKSYNDDGSLNVVLDNEIEGTLSNDGKTYISDDELYSLEDLGDNQIRETTIDPKTRIETVILWENNNIFFYKKGDIGLSFHEDMQVKSVDVDSEGNLIATLSDEKKYKVEDEGKKLVSINGLLKIEAIKNPDGSTTIRKTSIDRITGDKTILELKDGKVILYSDKDGEVKLDTPVNPNLVEGIVEAEREGNEIEIAKNGESYEILNGEPPIDKVPVEKEIKAPVSWKIIDSDIDEGTTTITYGDGKSVTMRTEMLNTIAPELNMIEDFDEIKVKGNTLTYTTKGDDSYNAVIEFNDDGTKKSKTYTKKNSEGLTTAQTIYEFDENGEVKLKTHLELNEDGTYTKTVTDKDGKSLIQLETEISGEVKLGVGISTEVPVSINIDEIWSNKMGIKLNNVYEKDGVLYATLEDGSKGILLVDENKFVYDDSGDGVIHTLQAIEGGSLLEYYKDESEDYGTIKISIDKKTDDEVEKETIIFEGIYDEDKKIIKKGKEIIAEIDEDGRILTDFNKKGEAQTIHYPASNKFFGTYAFGKVQNDQSEKIFLPGYVPLAFKTESGNLVIITTDEDGNRIYTDANGNELNENSAGVKEAKAMVTKSLIGPAFYAAVEGARGGIALSNLLNSWLDIDFITNWRKKSDEFFSQTVIGRIISGKWEESICHYHIEKIPDSVAVVNINGDMGFAAHVEGERSAAITTSNETLYFYKITFGVNPYGMGNITFELLIDGNKADLDGDGTADKIKLE